MIFNFFYYSLFLFIFLIGAQFILKDNYINNWAFIFDLPDDKEKLLKETKIPFDGWILTFIICLIPILNLLYILFFIILGLLSQDSYFILLMKEGVKK